MNKALKQIDQHKWLYLTAIFESEEAHLTLVLEEGRVLEQTETIEILDKKIEDCHRVVVDEQCFAYQVVFERYKAYLVRDEEYANGNDDAEYEGRSVCIYTRSAFLNYMETSTWGDDRHPGPITHYGFNCSDHIIDVAALKEPKVTILRTPVTE